MEGFLVHIELYGLKQLYSSLPPFLILTVSKRYGIRATGEIFYPKEKKKISVRLNKKIERTVATVIKEIKELIKSSRPPSLERKPYCKKCSYYNFCWVE